MIWYLQTNILNNMIKVIKHKKASQSQLNQDQIIENEQQSIWPQFLVDQLNKTNELNWKSK